ncbi:kinase-like domain-containing protein [Chaetomium fimeti]|uniref:Kinase-like domain-containing protein n=1 Tax=Chaetomium fimeti TaxID=1854472 RepID=A0AAE0LUV4_9PEZI|nr:kinase-like domain-containing protein [Chaetomium fimeti]
MPPDSTSSWVTIHDFLQNGHSRATSYFRRTQWDQLCLIASNTNRHLECFALDKVTGGLNNLVRLLEFSDGSRWAARIRIKSVAPLQAGNNELGAEVATMQFVKEHSNVPIPRVFAYATNEDNPAGVAYMLIEVLPGVVAMDALGGYHVHRGVISTGAVPSSFLPGGGDMSSSLRLPKIGTIVRNRDGEYECGSLPGIGGPFNTAAEFFEAWADNVKFKWDKETIRSMMQRGPIPAERMIAIIDQFPSQVKEMASRISATNNGPFPLCHDDFLHSNIMVDEDNFNVTGIIDWEGACTVPWELIAFPEFLQTVPASFDLPQKYDRQGQPFDEEVRQTWRERREYIEMVKLVEREDKMLSTCLGSDRSQTLAYAYGAYTSTGKLGFYDRVVEQLTREAEN